MKILCKNKKANFEYFIDKKIECGICLNVSEIKSIIFNNCNLNGSYVDVENGELFIVGMNIARGNNHYLYDHEEKRVRKLLAHKKEILEMQNWKQDKGNTLIPLEVYSNNGKVKVLVGLAKGKKNYDKRESIKKKDIEREISKKYKGLMR